MAYKSGFDTENDPVVFTTDYGLEIRYSNSLTYFTNYTYFTMAGYNWVIIGYDPSMYECVQEVSGEAFRDNPIEGGDFLTQFETVDKSAAGSAIMRDNFAISKWAVPNFEIGDGCVLCLCETYISGNCAFRSSGNNYVGSILQTKLTTFYNNNLTDLPIKPQTLKTMYYGNSEGIDIEDQHLFPLAGASKDESFYCGNYLEQINGGDIDLECEWWLRSGDVSNSANAWRVNTEGLIARAGAKYDNKYARPAFVLEL